MNENTLVFPSDPFFLQWHINDACNMRCKHCYNSDFTHTSIDEEKLYYVIDEYSKFLDYINKRGRIQFAGGEPFLSPHLFDLIKTARTKNMAVRILSNGTLVDDNIIEQLIKSGCYIIQISIEGKEKTHDKIRGKGSYKKALKGAALLKENGIEVTLAMTLSKTNVKDIPHLFSLASKYGNRIGFNRLVPIGSGQDMLKEMLSKEQLLSAYKKIYELRQKYTDIDVPLRDPIWRGFFPNFPKDTISGCSAGYNGLCIGSNGDVFPCRRFPVKIGNVFESSLIDLWDAPLMQDLRSRDKRKGKCADCDRVWVCGGCPGIAHSVNGHFLNEDPQCFKDIHVTTNSTCNE